MTDEKSPDRKDVREMPNRAVLIHPDLRRPAEVVTWEYAELLGLLYRSIGCDCVDKGPVLQTHLGEMVFWVDDTGLVNGSEPDYNDYAVGIARACGWPVGALAGIVVVTGGYDAIGGTLGLSDALVDLIVSTVADASQRVVSGSDG